MAKWLLCSQVVKRMPVYILITSKMHNEKIYAFATIFVWLALCIQASVAVSDEIKITGKKIVYSS